MNEPQREDSWGQRLLKQRFPLLIPLISFVVRHWQPCFLLGEFLLDLFFIWYGPYFPIDYDAYLDQIAKIREGEWIYSNIRGRTGPVLIPPKVFVRGLVPHLHSLFEIACVPWWPRGDILRDGLPDSSRDQKGLTPP